MKGKAHKKGRYSCAFCDRQGQRSREHFWPAWAADLLPESPFHTREKTVVGQEPEFHWSRQGAPKVIQLPVVCRPCNSGWMSRLESQCRQHLEALIRQTPFELDADSVRELAIYFSMKVMVADLSIKADAVFDQSARTKFFQTRAIPVGLSLFLYRFENPIHEIPAYNKELIAAKSILPNGEIKNFVNAAANFVFRFGPTLVQALYIPELAADFSIRPGGVKLYPPVEIEQQWPLESSISTPVAFDVVAALQTMGFSKWLKEGFEREFNANT